MVYFSDALITKAHIQGYRSLENIQVELGPVTVLVGPNGSGKSSFIDALAFVRQALLTSPEEAFKRRGDIEQVITLTGQRPNLMAIEVEIKSRAAGVFEGSYYVQFRHLARNGFSIPTEICEMRLGPEQTNHRFVVEYGQWIETAAGVEPRLAQNRLALPLLSGVEQFAPMYEALTKINFYNFIPAVISAWQEVGPEDSLAPDGGNAASILQQIREKDTALYERIAQVISQIMPSVQSISPKKVGRRWTIEFSERFPGQKPINFQALSMSDGTLRLLAILLAAYALSPPTLTAFEEPEIAVHPGAMAVLADALKEAGLRTQILITTHTLRGQYPASCRTGQRRLHDWTDY
jgi:predicted ATPase